VAERFPEAIFDMAEAGKCLALDRSTASVFHLMRVTEYGLNGVSVFLKIKDPLGPNWDQIIKSIDSELKTEYAKGASGIIVADRIMEGCRIETCMPRFLGLVSRGAWSASN